MQKLKNNESDTANQKRNDDNEFIFKQVSLDHFIQRKTDERSRKKGGEQTFQYFDVKEGTPIGDDYRGDGAKLDDDQEACEEWRLGNGKQVTSENEVPGRGDR